MVYNTVSDSQCMVSEFEAGFIRLLDKLTNGSRIEIDVTGEQGMCGYYETCD